ncbi:MAG: hypothetical protein LBS52_08145 [Dysgonamonadaceae bacterium]|jgi:hypothetical protein|nr:hypothetical protein [Dysgonamonadaceae bacterium]
MPHLYYRIAEYSLLIDTPNAEKTAAALPSFFNFKSGASDDLLFRFSGGEAIPISDDMREEEVFDMENVFRSKSYKNSSGERIVSLEIEGEEHFVHISSDLRAYRSDLDLTNPKQAAFLNIFLKLAFILSSAPLKTIKMHASVTEKDGKALLFLGVSGTGKSTHSSLWRKYVPGVTLLNDDEPIVRLLDDCSVRVYGAPWSGGTACYRNVSANISAFVHLHQSPENKLTKLNGREAFTSLFISTHTLRTDSKIMNDVFNTVADILEQKAVYRLDCRPDREAVSLTEQLM